ncbi:MAG TPA: zinc ribbon domain-containing protein [Pirellulaceae bacterium]|nr:zinc ribbon domain-containing protein [Pirellulaceae bacterium]
MRLLVQCDQCRLRYDATGRRVGGKFRCRCGEVLTIKRPRGHEADVVHCAACGAAREHGEKSCGYCGADFTIHETDLDTVCPGCQARVSDRARYCHHCATPLAADLVAGKASKLTCPICPGRHLVSRRLTDLETTVLECRVCAGMWIGLETLHDLLDGEERRPQRGSVSHRLVPIETHRGYRKCPQCSGLMVRRNFGQGQSGVVLDVCGEHGLWFDCDELAHLLSWVRSGGLEAARRDVARLKRSPDLRRKRMTPDESRAAETAATAHLKQLRSDHRDSDLAIDLTVIARSLAYVIARLR